MKSPIIIGSSLNHCIGSSHWIIGLEPALSLPQWPKSRSRLTSLQTTRCPQCTCPMHHHLMIIWWFCSKTKSNDQMARVLKKEKSNDEKVRILVFKHNVDVRLRVVIRSNGNPPGKEPIERWFDIIMNFSKKTLIAPQIIWVRWGLIEWGLLVEGGKIFKYSNIWRLKEHSVLASAESLTHLQGGSQACASHSPRCKTRNTCAFDDRWD